MTLDDTKYFMIDDDYKTRFKAEYWQTKIRYDKLQKLVVKCEAGTLDFKPACSLQILKNQKAAMGSYLYWMEVRAEIEDICIDFPSENCCADDLKKLL